jgi:hypothetical protein
MFVNSDPGLAGTRLENNRFALVQCYLPPLCTNLGRYRVRKYRNVPERLHPLPGGEATLHMESIFRFPPLPFAEIFVASFQPVRKIVKNKSGLGGKAGKVGLAIVPSESSHEMGCGSLDCDFTVTIHGLLQVDGPTDRASSKLSYLPRNLRSTPLGERVSGGNFQRWPNGINDSCYWDIDCRYESRARGTIDSPRLREQLQAHGVKHCRQYQRSH